MTCADQHLAIEHYRVHVIERWPDGPRKTASLAAARSTAAGLHRIDSDGSRFVCMSCGQHDVRILHDCPAGVEKQPNNEKEAYQAQPKH